MSAIGFNIGLRALLTAQAALDTTGHNIANANTPGYSRQGLGVSTANAVKMRNLMMGNGVQADVVKRTVDTLLHHRLVQQASGVSRLDASLQTMSEVEGMLGNSTQGGINLLLQSFFGSLSTLSATPEDPVQRSSAVQSATQLADQFNQLSTNLETLRRDTLGRLQAHVDRVNQLSTQISGLNQQILGIEASGVDANDLRDRRDQSIRELSELINARVFEDERGAVRVLVGGSLLVSPAGHSRMQVESDAAGTFSVQMIGQTVETEVTGGAIGGLLSAAQDFIPALEQKLDLMARNLVLAVNRVHSTGIGADGPFRQLVSTNPLVDVDGDGSVNDELLANAGLPFDISSGELVINVTDLASGAVEKQRISIVATHTTVAGLLSDLNAIDHLSANVDGQGRLHVFSEPGYGFEFSSRLDPDPDPLGAFGGGQASLATPVAGPFALIDGDTLDLTGPSGSFTITFDALDFAQIGQATAAEIADLINADPNAQANGLVAGAVGDRLVLQTAGSGASETFDVDGGTALGALGWSAGTTVAGHDLAVSVEISGAYTGDTNDSYTFVPNMDGTVGTTNGLKILVLDSTGAQVAALDVGVGYVPGDEIEVLNGVRLELSYGTLSATDHDVFELDVTADSDTADILSALGLNGLFTGYDAGSIGVRADIIADPILLAGSHSGAPGDGTNLLALLELDDQAVDELGQITIGQYYSDIISGVGLQIGSTESALDAEQFLLQSLEARRDQISGVNVDEEMVNLITSEQAFNAASQFLRVTAELSEELMNIL